MAAVILKDQIKFLVDLQKVDSEIFSLKNDLKEKPEVITSLTEDFEKEKKNLKELEDKIKAIALKRKEAELELKTKEESIVKANGALSTLKTNKEYSAKLAEIESIKADKSLIEETILKLYDDADSVQKLVDREKIVVAEKEKGFLTQKKDLETAIRVAEDKIKVLEVSRQQFLPGVDKNLLSRYEKILNHKEGLAIVPVKNYICGGCYMNLTIQMINVIKAQTEIVQCEMCTRILYLEENL